MYAIRSYYGIQGLRNEMAAGRLAVRTGDTDHEQAARRMPVESIGDFSQPQAGAGRGNDRHRQQGGGFGKARLVSHRLPDNCDGTQRKRLACVLRNNFV